MTTPIPNPSYKLKTCEMHTCGEPVRILESTEPAIKFPDKLDILEKRKYFSENYDFIRKMLMFEPRGHKNMFGVMLTEPNEKSESHYGLLFMNTIDYAPMCGHITIAIGRYLLEKKLIKPKIPETTIKLDCPCGLVEISVEWDGATVGKTKLLSVPAFVQCLDYEIFIPQLKINVKCDIAYGGNFFAIISSKELGVDFDSDPPSKVVQCGIYLLNTLKKQFTFRHLICKEIEYLYAVLITDCKENSIITKVMCAYGDESFDRSPCGSGTTAIIACQYFRKYIKLMEKRITQNSFLGEHSNFQGIPIEEKTIVTENGEINCITVQISGRAYFIGENTFTYEEDDFYKFGFNV